MPASASILIVDDDFRNTLALEALLQPLNARVSVARSGAEALARLDREPFDVVLLDVRLPDISGFEVGRRAAESRDGGATILYLSAQDDPRGPGDASDYFNKPLDTPRFLSRLGEILAGRPVTR